MGGLTYPTGPSRSRCPVWVLKRVSNAYTHPAVTHTNTTHVLKMLQDTQNGRSETAPEACLNVPQKGPNWSNRCHWTCAHHCKRYTISSKQNQLTEAISAPAPQPHQSAAPTSSAARPESTSICPTHTSGTTGAVSIHHAQHTPSEASLHLYNAHTRVVS